MAESFTELNWFLSMARDKSRENKKARSLISLILKEEHLFSLTHSSLFTHTVSGLQGLTEVRVTRTASCQCLQAGGVFRVNGNQHPKYSDFHLHCRACSHHTTNPQRSLHRNKCAKSETTRTAQCPSFTDCWCFGSSTGTISSLVQGISLQQLPLHAAGPWPGAPFLLLQLLIPKSRCGFRLVQLAQKYLLNGTMHISEKCLFWLVLPGSWCPAHSLWAAPRPLVLQIQVLSWKLAPAHRSNTTSYCLLAGDVKMSKRAGEIKTDWEMTENRRWWRSHHAAGWLVTLTAREIFELKLCTSPPWPGFGEADSAWSRSGANGM